MRLIVNGRNITVTPALKEYVEEKIGRVAKHYDQILEIEVTLGVTKNPSVHDNHFAEVTCSVNGTKIHVTESAESMYASIDLLADKLDRQVKRHKEKMLDNKGQSIRTVTEREADKTSEAYVNETEISESELSESQE